MSSISSQDELTIVLGFACSVASVIGALFTIFTYVFIKSTRSNFFFFLVFHLALSDLFVAISGLELVQPLDLDSDLCLGIATIRGFAIMSSFILNLLIALYLYKAITSDSDVRQMMTEKRNFLITNYSFALFGTFGPLFSNSYGPSTIYCWINTINLNDMGQFWLIAEAYITLPVIMIWVSLLYYWIIKTIKQKSRKGDNSPINKLAVIPLIFLIVNLFTIINFFNNSAFIEVSHVIFRQLQGVFHALFYGFAIVRKEIRKKYSKDLSEPIVSEISSSG
jgi:hypothetical protein